MAREELAAQRERLQKEIDVEAVDVARDARNESHFGRCDLFFL